MSSRREFFKKGILAGAGFAILKTGLGSENKSITEPAADITFVLPALPYAFDALEPFIDKQTMELHHGKHHQAYVDKLNKAISEITEKGIRSDWSIEAICKDISKFPAAVRNNGGGHYNHSMFWKSMKPNPGSVLSPPATSEPTGKLGDAIKSAFGSFTNFKSKFTETSTKIFGSGWAWLVVSKDGKLEIGSTPNQDNPLMDISEFKGIPILGLDVWEHAYYLKYQNKRADYINAWWNLVNWEEAGKRLP